MDVLMDRLYRGFRFILDGIVARGAAIVMLAATSLAIAEVIRRYIFGVTFHWGQDAVTYGLVGAVFLFFAVTQARRSHLAVAALTDEFKRRGYVKLVLWLRIFVSAISLWLFAGLAWWGIPTIERSFLMERTSQSMILLMWPFQLVLLISFALMAIGTIFHLYQDVRELMGKKVFDWAPYEEGIDI